jgi:ATP-dependent Clp protease ATP-binding subunit ClpC
MAQTPWPAQLQGSPEPGGSVIRCYAFTWRVRHCLIAARHEAGRLGHGYVGTEHLLLGLLAVPDGLPAHIADALRIDRASLRAEVERRAGRGPMTAELPDIPYATEAKLVLEHTMDEAARLGADEVDSADLLLGMLAEGKSIAAEALRAQGLELERARQVIATAEPPVPLPPPSLLKRFSTWLSGDTRPEPERPRP